MNRDMNERLISLDAFRGYTVAAMILVNSPGTYRAVYSQFKHAQWNGWTFADTVFPFFLFIMGVSIVFSQVGRVHEMQRSARLDLRIVKRTLVLFGLGLFMNAYPIFHLSTIRIPGVLQRIALCYFFTCLIVMRYRSTGRALWVTGLLAAYWLALCYAPVPGVGAGVLGPSGNIVGYVDSLFLTGHMWGYDGGTDPEGMLSAIPAIGTVLLGALTGDWLKLPLTGRRKAAGMLCAGMVLTIMGMLMDRWLPINKTLWTPSFCILMAGLALLVFGVFYWLIDVMGYRRWAAAFVIFGANAIAVYFLSEILDTSLRFVLQHAAGSTVNLRGFLFRSIFAPLGSPQNASLMFAAAYDFLMFLVAWTLWRAGVVIKI